MFFLALKHINKHKVKQIFELEHSESTHQTHSFHSPPQGGGVNPQQNFQKRVA